MSFEKVYVLDTNILLEDASNIFKISDENKNLIVLPETVLDEIDTKKSGFDEINFQAREFARILENSQIIESKKVGSYKIIRLKIFEPKSAIIDVISKEEYSISTKNVALNIINDRKILEIASFCDEYYKSSETTFLSLDIMARTRAVSLDIKTDSLIGSYKDEFNYEFIKTVEIPFEKTEFLDNALITDFDENYQPYNFSYCFKVKSSDQVILAAIKNKRVYLLDETQIRDQVITPLNKEQLFFSNAILSHFYNVLIIEAKAGSGKTLLALSGALKLVRQKHFQKIIYIRNSIESLDKGEDVGYLPGYEEKFKIYNHPLMDSLDYIIRSEYKKKRANRKNNENIPELDDQEVNQRVEQMIQNYGIETMWVGEMRGRTLSNSFVIIDEAQNMSNKTMQMVLSRIDSTCKVVVLGSNKQIDNFYVNKHTNALTTLLKSTKNRSELVEIFAIKLQKVLRGPITEWAEKIFTTKNK
ncbi:PhoH family protein [Halarcobacter anaerophilus]|uniref:PhoH-like protein n=1 Tax=Halarcobacter anaerophilus TaxID=877500 RepID=A0A4Q0Y1S8_9BACT|nr:PhoH family protein [Halarcobacter anaerophilus]QDF27681.1 putative ribonuclease, YlaK/PhoH family [Halarcobacter anaerophilus]RXJ64027.1 phosphate starvation-inducible protein PhoH [Halarcobacter anaerophilus]